MPPASVAGTAVTVIVGDEELLVERAVRAAVSEAGAGSAEAPDVHDVRGGELRPVRVALAALDLRELSRKLAVFHNAADGLALRVHA